MKVNGLTRRSPRRTESPLTISSPRSTSEAKTMTKSKTFHPLRKKSVPMAPSLIRHSIVNTAVNTYSHQATTNEAMIQPHSSATYNAKRKKEKKNSTKSIQLFTCTIIQLFKYCFDFKYIKYYL